SGSCGRRGRGGTRGPSARLSRCPAGLVESLLYHGGLVGDPQSLLEDRDRGLRVAAQRQRPAQVIEGIGIGEARRVGGVKRLPQSRDGLRIGAGGELLMIPN